MDKNEASDYVHVHKVNEHQLYSIRRSLDHYILMLYLSSRYCVYK